LKYIDEYRDKVLVDKLINRIRIELTRSWTLMEICGGQTHSIMKYGLPELIPGEITMIHGPGCPVCVTPVELIEHALAIARQEHTILASFGDMLRVPGITGDLLSARSQGADIRMVYSPLDSLRLAEEHPDREVVFFAVGFETTAPAVALTIREADRRELENFSVLVSHVLVPPAMEALLSDPAMQIDAFLAAGHVCTVMGYDEYVPIARRYRIPVVVTGFEPVDILQGILHAVRMLERGEYRVENAYSRSVKAEGNLEARKLLQEVFRPCDRKWRGIGIIPASGYEIREEFSAFDAALRFGMEPVDAVIASACIAGEILTGKKKPTDCPEFGRECTPEHPLGAPMVSPEGACAAYFRYKSKPKTDI